MKSVYTLADLRDWANATRDCVPPLRLAVIGDPVAHSKSPQMHNPALAAAGIDAAYTRLHILPGEVEECIRLLPGAGFIGINCTIPHKGSVLAAVNQPDETARRAGGVNTVIVQPDGTTAGTSTDGGGFSRAVRESFGVGLAELRVLVLGAGGGAGRAVAMQCAAENCVSLTLANRTVEKLPSLASEIGSFYPADRVSLAGDDSLAAAALGADLVVNCTAVGMKADDPSPLPASMIAARHLVYDTIYVGHRTPLLRAADEAGSRGANGLAMLLHQGALSFERWFSRPAPLEVMRAGLLGQSPSL
ncbi:MAG: shikimate dehydrogenase [Verrucomicrobiota bacterium]|jgi:shikimate dehydrogenase